MMKAGASASCWYGGNGNGESTLRRKYNVTLVKQYRGIPCTSCPQSRPHFNVA
jgi:hypothetical protein